MNKANLSAHGSSLYWFNLCKNTIFFAPNGYFTCEVEQVNCNWASPLPPPRPMRENRFPLLAALLTDKQQKVQTVSITYFPSLVTEEVKRKGPIAVFKNIQKHNTIKPIKKAVTTFVATALVARDRIELSTS